MGKEPEWERRRLVCPKDLCGDVSELLTFIQLPAYTEAFKGLDLTDDEQRLFELGVMMNPLKAEVIEGTGGIREALFGTPKDGPGSLHLSVFYAYFPETGKVVLIDLAETDEVGELADGERAELKRLFEEIQEFGPEAWEG